MTKEEITRIVMNGATGEYSHCVIYCDHWDYTDSYTYVRVGEDVNDVIADIRRGGSPGMYSIEEVYNYSLDLNSQLDERRAYHIEPLSKPKKCECEEVKSEESSTLEFDHISDKFKSAIEYASRMHGGQMRKSGEPYINHPLRVVQNVLRYKKSKHIEELMISACLHDTIEDTSATYYDIVERFGMQVASLVLELSNDEDMKKEMGKERYLSIKMKNMSSWALVIKLCDRLDNISDFENHKDIEFKSRYIDETIGIVDFLLKNGKLTKTHLSIIGAIIRTLLSLSKSDAKRTRRLAEIFDVYSELKKASENIGIYSKLLEYAGNLDDGDASGKRYVL